MNFLETTISYIMNILTTSTTEETYKKTYDINFKVIFCNLKCNTTLVHHSID